MDYDFPRLGCPLQANWQSNFLPKLLLCQNGVCDKRVEANFIIWEENNRPFQYNATMQEVGCLKPAQMWSTMGNESDRSNWGPQNYESCFVYDNTTDVTELTDRYQILNATNNVSLILPKEVNGVYIFHVRVVDPFYSFCRLEAEFAVDVWGEDPGKDVKALGISILTWFSLVVLMLVGSYIHFRNNVYLQLDL